jgi:cell division protein FtsL
MARALSSVSAINYPIHPRVASQKRIHSSVRSKNKTFWVSLLMSIVFVSTLVFYLSLNIQLVEANFELKSTENKLEQIDVKTQEIESQIVGSLSIEKIRLAAKNLKLVKAENIKFVRISDIGNLSMAK